MASILEAENPPEPIARARARCRVLRALQIVLVLGGGVALLSVDPADWWIGYPLAVALLALEAAGWAIGARAVRQAPGYGVKEHLAAARLATPQVRLLGVTLVLTAPVFPFVFVVLGLEAAVVVFLCAAVAVGWGCYTLRMLLRRSWFGGPWIPYRTPPAQPAG